MLNGDDIKRLVKGVENWQVEFKLAKGGVPDTFWESYSAFANTDGGVIILGVRDQDGVRTIEGVVDSDRMIQDIWNAANNTGRVSANVLFNRQVYSVACDKKTVIVIEVPRAERRERPVFVGADVFRGTFRRNGEGDYHCGREAVTAMLRDQCVETADTCLIDELTIGDLNADSIRRYRMMFAQIREGHAWTKLPDDEFLVKIGAARKDAKGMVRPMLSGLVCFGDFAAITNVLPGYFLDYRERLGDGSRWTDRIAAHDSDWSGNIVDFYFRIYDRITSDIKVPFKLNDRGIREEQTPFHKSLRELLANALIHADYHGRRGIVIEKQYNTLTYRNPGGLRLSKAEAIAGGNSDARNVKIFNIFALINVGERSGMGLSDLFARWEAAGYAQPTITETYDPDQVTVTVQVELARGKVAVKNAVKSGSESEVAVKDAVKLSGKSKFAPKPAPKIAVKDAVKIAVKRTSPKARPQVVEKCAELYQWLKDDPQRTVQQAVSSLGYSERSVFNYLEALKDASALEHHGPANGGEWVFMI